MEILASFPSPSESEIDLGPLPLRGYALCIIIGVFLAIWLGNRRWVQRGGQPGTVADIAVWAVPFGLIGARIYHVVTDYQLYFDEGRDWVDSFKIWDGGIGVWGAIAGGALGAWIACRRRGIALPPLADALAPGIVFAQAIGRWGNWFNQELYGKSTDLPWAVEIDNGLHQGTFHPTFLYESLWCLGVGALVIWADRRFRLGHGRAFALYVAAYTVGRFWIEYLRIDEVNEIAGLRLNNWTSLAVFAAAVAYLVLSAKRKPGREETVEPVPAPDPDGEGEPAPEPAAEAERDERVEKDTERDVKKADPEKPEVPEEARGAESGADGDKPDADEDAGAAEQGTRAEAGSSADESASEAGNEAEGKGENEAEGKGGPEQDAKAAQTSAKQA